MNFRDWYTDTVDIYRVQQTLDGALTRNERAPIGTGIPCRVYQLSGQSICTAVSRSTPCALFRRCSGCRCLYCPLSGFLGSLSQDRRQISLQLF